MNQDKMGFFSGDAVPYIYDHDSLHRAMAHGVVPAYTLYQKDGEQVAVDRAKWDVLPLSVKLASVDEEACVLALERSQIPSPGVLTPDQSFMVALRKVCTSITSGWWREFAWEHYDQVVGLHASRSSGYVDAFREALASGVVVPVGR